MTQAANGTEPERVNKHGAAGILGVSVRSVIEMAAQGKLPGAAKIGRCWTFDCRRLRRFVRDKETETWRASQIARRRPAATGARVSFGAASRRTAAISDGAYTRATRLLRCA